jgi:thioredoxin 1
MVPLGTRHRPGDVNMEPTRDEVDRLPGPVVLEFGADWCPHCQAIQPDVARLLASHPAVRHIKVEDGKGKPLGRSFRVKLWPTLMFLKDGAVVGQLVRPSAEEIGKGFTELAG